MVMVMVMVGRFYYKVSLDNHYIFVSQKTPASTPPTFLFWLPTEKQWMVRPATPSFTQF